MFWAVDATSFLSTGIRSLSKAFNVISLDKLKIKSGLKISMCNSPSIYSDAATSCKESIRPESRKRQDLIHRIQREERM